MLIEYTPKGVCSRKMTIEVEDGKILSARVIGGCNGNLKAIGKLVEGMTVEAIEEKLKGNTCGPRATSCADQLAIAVREAYNKTTGES